jgi:hypothetical protein
LFDIFYLPKYDRLILSLGSEIRIDDKFDYPGS